MSAFPSADQPLPHFVSTAPFDPQSIGRMTPEQEKAALASQWRLMWIKFRRHRLAVWSGAFLVFIYLVALFASRSRPTAARPATPISSAPRRRPCISSTRAASSAPSSMATR